VPQDRNDFTGIEGHADIVNRMNATKRFFDVAQLY
jgi:hypothetical protein